MPPTRKAHHKSRRGCLQCKKRHVKCDEAQPSCSNCVKREAPCSFSHEQSPSISQQRLGTPGAPESRQPVLSRLEEMDLMHCFTTTTIKTICHDPKDWHMWEFAVPQLAFQNEYLLDIMLALTCLHRAHLEPTKKGHWITCAIEYQDRALPEFHKVLTDVNDETCHAAFAFSLATTMVELAMPQLDRDPIDYLVGLRSYFRGSATLYLTMLEPLKHGGMNAFFKPKTIIWKYDPEIRQWVYSTIFDMEMQRWLTTSSSFHTRISGLYDLVTGSQEERVYIEAIALLLKLFYDSPYSIMVFSLFVGPDFFQLLYQREPLAVLIYIYCGVVFNNVNEWWGDGVGKRIVNGLTLPADILEQHPKWASALLWAQEQVMNPPEPDRVLFWRIFDSKPPDEQVIDLLHPDDTLLNLRSKNPSSATTPNQSALGNEVVKD